MSGDRSKVLDFQSRWPKAGDRLFIASAQVHDARIVRDPGERFYRMPMGFKRAGDLLIDQAAADVVDRSNVIYAGIYCYRQSIELFLKKLIADFGNEKEQSPKNTHDLNRLWERFVCIINERGRGETELRTAQTLVAEMHEADQKSDGFRFPTDSSDKPFAFGDRDIDLTNVREVMQGLTNFFEYAYLNLSHQDEMATEASRYGEPHA